MTPVRTDLPGLPAPGAHGGSPRFRERARYELPGVARVLCTRVTAEVTLLVDMPADQFDRATEPAPAAGSYVVEPELSTDPGELDALVTDYLKQVELHARVPMTVPWLKDVVGTLPL